MSDKKKCHNSDSLSECEKSSNAPASKSSIKLKDTKKRKQRGNHCKWSHEEKQRFVSGLSKKYPFRKEDGTIDWLVLKGFIGSGKTVAQVKQFAKKFHMLEHGKIYPEFATKAAVDIWRQLAESATNPEDKVANVCVPQVLTVAALEPIPSNSADAPINYSNVYNYLSAVTRGTEVPELPPDDAQVVLELIEDLIKLLSKSETLIQRQFMHKRYAELRNSLFKDGTIPDSSAENLPWSSSTNPYSIPFDVLDFKRDNEINKNS